MATTLKEKLFVYLASASVIFPAILLVVSGLHGYMDGVMQGVGILGQIGSPS